MEKEIEQILEENQRRREAQDIIFNPYTGQGSPGERILLEIPDFFIKQQWVPERMLKVKLVRELKKKGVRKVAEQLNVSTRVVEEQFTRIRLKYDFAFWCYALAKIKNKEGGDDIPFRLNRPQRRLVEEMDRQWFDKELVRIIMLKARQWGGSTLVQNYIAHKQLAVRKGLNSLIVGHVKDASAEVESMFDLMLDNYPIEFLYDIGTPITSSTKKIESVHASQNIRYIPARNCKIKIGTAEKPNSARGGDSALVHCTEVAFWRKTEGKSPQAIIRSATAGATYRPDTIIVYESTANGTGNFFQREYDAAKNGKSQFVSFFVPWMEIELYQLEVADKELFARWLWENRDNTTPPDDHHTTGAYLWKLWNMGATLENIQWYVLERTKYDDDADMMAEFPSDDVEAFKHSGARVFDEYRIEGFKPGCRPPKYIGEVYADADEGEDCMKNLRFREDKQGSLWIWDKPEVLDVEVRDRYLTVVDIGGRGNKADWSVIVVFDRYWMIEDDKPAVVAQWYGHIDMDLLAWKAAQIAAYYDDSLLVIESNTLETHDRDRDVDGDQSSYILNQLHDIYPNLYARKQSEEDIKKGLPKKYGFHTNISTKPKVISTLVKVIREQLYIERDIRCLDEYVTYEKKPNGSFGAILGKHDDLLMTRAIGLHICFHEMDYPQIITESINKNVSRKIISAATL